MNREAQVDYILNLLLFNQVGFCEVSVEDALELDEKAIFEAFITIGSAMEKVRKIHVEKLLRMKSDGII